jgi:site-specific DNA recombinase
MNEEIKHPPKRVAIYVRVSTEEQLDGYGPDMQKDAVMNMIRAKENVPEPFKFAGENHIYFDEGISGTIPLDERPQFARLKEAILFSSKENRPFDIVAVYRIDRFARKLEILLDLIHYFKENDIQFLSVTENIDTSTPFGKAILGIMGVIAELEVETIKQRTQSGREIAAQSGVFMGNAPPFGYTKNKEKKLQIIEKEAKYVQRIFDLFVNQKYSVGEIALYLQEQSVPSPEASALLNKKRKGVMKKLNSTFHWTHQGVRTLLKNEIYTGNYYYKKHRGRELLPKKDWKLSPYKYPIIIDLVTFHKAQEVIEQARHERPQQPKRRQHPYILSGLLKCDQCKDLRKDIGSYQYWVGAPKKIKTSGKYTHYYSCGRKNRKKYEKPCTALPLPAKEIEEYIANFCLDMLESPIAVFEHQQKLKSQKLSLKNTQDKIEEMNSLLAGIPSRKNHILEQHERGHIATDVLDKKLEDLKRSEELYKKELSDLQKQMAENTLSENYLASLELFGKKYSSILKNIKNEPDEVYRVLHMLIDEVIVYSRPVATNDVIAGRKSKDQQIPNRLHIKLKLPQVILNEIAQKHNPAVIIEKAPIQGASSSQKTDSRRRLGIRTLDLLGVNEAL